MALGGRGVIMASPPRNLKESKFISERSEAYELLVHNAMWSFRTRLRLRAPLPCKPASVPDSGLAVYFSNLYNDRLTKEPHV